MTSTPCVSFRKYKATFEPRCNCYPCWQKFFKADPGRMYSAYLVMNRYGVKVLEKVRGRKFVQALKQFLAEEAAKGTIPNDVQVHSNHNPERPGTDSGATSPIIEGSTAGDGVDSSQ